MQRRLSPHPPLWHRLRSRPAPAHTLIREVAVATVGAVAASPVEPVAHSIAAGLLQIGAHSVVIVASTLLGGN